MARGAVPVTGISRSGVELPIETTGDATNNHSVVNDGKTLLLARNTNGASTDRTVTVHVTRTVDGQAVASRSYPVAAGKTKALGPFPPADYGDTLLVDVDNAELMLRAIRFA